MKKPLFVALTLGTLTLGATFAAAPQASAWGGCGPGFHRGYYGACRPNFVGGYYPGWGYWYGGHYWHSRYWHGGWRYR